MLTSKINLRSQYLNAFIVMGAPDCFKCVHTEDRGSKIGISDRLLVDHWTWRRVNKFLIDKVHLKFPASIV